MTGNGEIPVLKIREAVFHAPADIPAAYCALAFAASTPMIAWVHANRSFDRLFMLLAVVALFILLAVLMLPRAIPARAQGAAAE